MTAHVLLWLAAAALMLAGVAGTILPGLELIARRPMVTAARVGFGTWLGLVVGTLVKLALAISMLGLFAAAYVL